MVAPELMVQLLAICGVLVVAYVVLVRPQLRRQSAHLSFLASLRLGDQVVTRGGLVGRIVEMDDSPVLGVELSKSVRVRALKSSIEERFETKAERMPA